MAQKEHGNLVPTANAGRGNHSTEGIPAVADVSSISQIAPVGLDPKDRGRIVYQTTAANDGIGHYILDGLGGFIRFSGGVTAHSALTGLTVGNDHTQYQLRSEQGAAGGYPDLDGSSKVPDAQISQSSITQHEAAINHASLGNLTVGDPHTQYQQESEKNTANGYAGLGGTGLLSAAQVPDGADATAIHDNLAGEISAIALKAVPVSADLLLIEDSAALNVKKRVTIGSLPSGGSSGLTPTSVKTADYVAVPGDLVRVQPSIGMVVISAPAAPTAFDRFGVLTLDNTFPVRIDGNGTPVKYEGEGSAIRPMRGIGFRADFFFDGVSWQYEIGNLDGPIVAQFFKENFIPAPGTPVTFFTLDHLVSATQQVRYRWEVDIHGSHQNDTDGVLAKLQAEFLVSPFPPVERFVRFPVFEAEGAASSLVIAFDLTGNTMNIQASHSDAVNGIVISMVGRVYADHLLDAT